MESVRLALRSAFVGIVAAFVVLAAITQRVTSNAGVPGRLAVYTTVALIGALAATVTAVVSVRVRRT